ncbi:MAG: hypothetical protein IKY70_01795, partial [Bacteroidales bacterium]|nr:hypothetical protein [Bacteroidales bacterium]
AVKSLASDFLSGLEIDNMEFFIPSLGVSEDIYSMLVENIDPKEVENPVNALYLYGSIESQVPVTFSVRPYLEGLATRFGDINIAEGVTPINDIRFNADDLYTLMLGYGSRLVLPVDLDRYYVNKKLTKTQEICINLKLRKTGGLKL